jgi:hypothetical protein
MLHKEVNHRIRYYSLEIYKNLFGEYILEKKYGSLKNKRPTGIKRECYIYLNDARFACAQKIQEKVERGYKKL